MLRRATVGTLPLGMFLALLVAAILSVGLLLVLLSYNNPASAQNTGTTIKVNTKADEAITDGNCSLREAITAANTNAPVD